LADEVGLDIIVHHFPPETSKWNKVEHRLFLYISKNWRGRSLIDLATVINLIANTKTETGLTVRCVEDKKMYKKGVKNSRYLLFTLFIFSLCIFENFLLGSDKKIEDVYVVGEKKHFLLIYPKEGMIGGPQSYASIPLSYPNTHNDFEIKFVEVKIESKISKGKYLLSVSVTNSPSKHNKTENNEVFFVIAQQSGKSVYVCCQTTKEPTVPGKEEMELNNTRYFYYFPFILARPPVFAIDDKLDGYLLEEGIPASFSRIKKNSYENVVTIEATKFYYESSNINTNNNSIVWLGKSIDAYLKCPDTKILFKEIQEWKDESDWLWKKMIRFDSGEYLRLYCVQIEENVTNIDFPKEVLELVSKNKVNERRKKHDSKLKK
jgi:hypothetical protein